MTSTSVRSVFFRERRAGGVSQLLEQTQGPATGWNYAQSGTNLARTLGGEVIEERVVEYVPLEPAQVDAAQVFGDAIARVRAGLYRDVVMPLDVFKECDALLTGLLSEGPSRSRPAVVDAPALPAGAVDEREARRDEAEVCQWCKGYGSLVPGRDDATPCGPCKGTGSTQGEPRPYTLTTAAASGPCGGCDSGYLEGQAVAVLSGGIGGDAPVMHRLCAILAVKKFDARKGTP